MPTTVPEAGPVGTLASVSMPIYPVAGGRRTPSRGSWCRCHRVGLMPYARLQFRVSRLLSEALCGRCPLLPGGVLRMLVPLLLVAGQAGAQVETSETVRLAPLIVPRADGEIVMDGRIDELAWQAVDPMPVVMHVPQFGAEPTERTGFRIVHDGKYLYFSCEAFDSDPAGIRAPSLLRDERRFLNDSCSIYLDTANDEENAMGFVTTPTGLRSDLTVANDAEGTVNGDWNTYWDVAVSQDDQGWYAEIRIPFSSLLFPVVDGRVVMGVSMLRNIARKNERLVFPAIPPRWGRSSFRKPSQMRKIELDGIRAAHPLYVTPYALGGGGYSHQLNVAGTGYERVKGRTREVGLDVKSGLTSNLNLDLTLNTDFAQVEADNQQVNLTRFSLFFPEKRRFFQERAAVFEYGMGDSDRLFHSRHIGLAGGEQVRIYGGARIVGRLGEWDIGLLDMQTEKSEGFPSENQGVLRLRRRVLNPYSYVGGILTSRLGTSGKGNVVYGLDGIFRIFGQDYLTMNWAQSFDHLEQAPDGGSIGGLDRGMLRSRWERRGQDGLTYALGIIRAGPVFEPGLGFLRRSDFTKAEGDFGYGWRPLQGSSRFLSLGLNVDGGLFRRNADGTVESGVVTTTVALETNSQHLWTLSLPVRYEDIESDFNPGGADAVVPSGRYRFASAGLSYRPPQGPPFRPTFRVEAGEFYDGRTTSFSFSPSWSASKHLNLRGSYGIDVISFADRGESLTAHVGRLRAEVMFSTALSLVTFVQYNSTNDAVHANFRVRYNPREGNDLYLVWNEGVLTNTSSFDPIRPWADQRTILIKYSHTIPFGA
jgi:hypothetical protein